MGDNDDLYRGGIESIHYPDIPTTLSEVAADVLQEDIRRREGSAKSRRNDAKKDYNVQLAEDHTLAPAEDHAHHLVITKEKSHQKANRKITRFEAYCKVCERIDTWATEDVMKLRDIRSRE